MLCELLPVSLIVEPYSGQYNQKPIRGDMRQGCMAAACSLLARYCHPPPPIAGCQTCSCSSEISRRCHRLQCPHNDNSRGDADIMISYPECHAPIQYFRGIYKGPEARTSWTQSFVEDRYIADLALVEIGDFAQSTQCLRPRTLRHVRQTLIAPIEQTRSRTTLYIVCQK